MVEILWISRRFEFHAIYPYLTPTTQPSWIPSPIPQQILNLCDRDADKYPTIDMYLNLLIITRLEDQGNPVFDAAIEF